MSDERVYIKEISVFEKDMNAVMCILGLLDPGESFKVSYEGYPVNTHTFHFDNEWFAQDDLEFNLKDVDIKKIVYYI
jgi:hypothetical protein